MKSDSIKLLFIRPARDPPHYQCPSRCIWSI